MWEQEFGFFLYGENRNYAENKNAKEKFLLFDTIPWKSVWPKFYVIYSIFTFSRFSSNFVVSEIMKKLNRRIFYVSMAR